jgi:hypothetical protein
LKYAINRASGLLASLLTESPAKARSVAIGDSLAVGFGQASHVRTIARVGISSCVIARMVPSEQFETALLSAGTNDPPGRCVEKVRERVHARRVIWVVPVNGARSTVLRVANAHGDGLLYYTPSQRGWPHPARYWKVI